MFRPFPDEELVSAIYQTMPQVKVIGVFDGALDPVPGMVYADITSAFTRFGQAYGGKKPPLFMNFKYGGGQNPSLSVLNGALQMMMEAVRQNKVDYPIRQLDRNSEGASIPLDLNCSKGAEVLAHQSIIEFVGRGGLGAVSAAANLVYIINDRGELFARGVPQFGSEKTGSPTFGVAVIDKQPITNFNVEGPRDLYVFFRPDLITSDHVQNLKEGGFFLVNTSLSPEEIRKRYQVPSEVRVYTIDASELARAALGKDFPNNVLLAALSHLRPDLLSLEELRNSIVRSLKKKGKEVININLKLLNEAASNLKSEGGTA